MKKILLLLLITAPALAQVDAFHYPEARKDTVIDYYFGTKVQDPYRWLENDTLSATQEWLEQEKKFSAKYLNRLRKKYTPDKQLQLNSYVDFGTIRKEGKYYFDYIRNDDGKVVSLHIKKKIDAIGEKIIDPTDYRQDKGDNTHIKSFSVSEDDKYIAFSINHNGSDWREIYVKTLYPSRRCTDFLEGVKFSPIIWSGQGFFYIRYVQTDNPLKDNSGNGSVWYHHLGDEQNKDRLIYQISQQYAVDLWCEKLNKGNLLIIYVSEKNEGRAVDRLVLAIDLKGNPGYAITDTIISDRGKESFNFIDVYKGKLLASTRQGAPHGQFILFDRHKKNKAELFIPEYAENLLSANVIGNKLIATYLSDADYKTVTFDTSGSAINELSFPAGTSVGGFDSEDEDSTTIFFYYSFLFPPIAYQYNTNDFSVKLVQRTKVAYDYSNFEITKEYYTSTDGTKIPVLIASKKGMEKNGKNPLLLYGYGGFGTTSTPFYDRGFMSFMQNGGIIALPCIRGGGEYGDNWHREGSKHKKQQSFDDFIRAAEYMVSEKYTNREKLAIMGGSNGGLLVAAVINQRPDICKVAIADKGVFDMLRFQKFTNGKAWLSEYGSSNDSTDFSYLIKYSPLHNVHEGSYPATLIITADHDDRVVPLHSYKYAALLQEKNRSEQPILLYEENNMGHSSANIETDAFIYSFIYDELEVPLRNLHTLLY